MRGRLGEIDRLRGWRVRERDVTIGDALAELQKDAKRASRREAAVDVSWKRVVPLELARQVTAGAISRTGVLSVRVSDAGAGYEFRRWVRNGGEAKLRAACPAITKVRVR